ncbi:hypothetical protein PSEUBRA_003514 [Kalmanozyma brasiliensis GHG001]|nr:uncharacterized protein PSEUBRA_003514 [Kalmanozyma brasiliensis GHG001]KAF6767257.1 hypothetical protein PSEUBRA_003514 [Kalmanozyma brasiliensis GHG001]
MRNDATVQGMILKADEIIFRQLLVQLDGMIGDDVSDQMVLGLKTLAGMMADRMEGLVTEALPEHSKTAKVQASQNMAQSLEQVAEVFEAVKAFREASSLDSDSDVLSRSLSPRSRQSSAHAGSQHLESSSADSFPSSAAGAASTSSLSLGLRGPAKVTSLPYDSRSRSKTPTPLGSLPLANLRLRRRDNFIRSVNQDSQPTWGRSLMHSHRDPSSSFESDFSSSTIEAMPNILYAPLAKKASRSRVASDGSGSISLTFGSLALAMPPNSMTQASSTIVPSTLAADWTPRPAKIEMQD